MKLYASIALTLACFSSALALQPNPPTWPSNVIVFTPGMGGAQATINNIYGTNGGSPDVGQFTASGYALLFTTGTHNLTVNVGYYTSVIGLDPNPANTNIGIVSCIEGNTSNYQVGALNTFWRSAENFVITPGPLPWGSDNGMLWAASQAAPLRRVIVNGDLYLFQYVPPDCCAGYASGGFIADCTVSGSIYSASQQQWFSRNTSMAGWPQSNWNMVFVGCPGAPASQCGFQGAACQSTSPPSSCLPFTNVGTTPLIAEKPYITLVAGRYYLNIPTIQQNKVGPTSPYTSNATAVDFENVYVATPSDTAASINAQIASNNHIILTPGQYNLTDSIQVNTQGTCILGIGFPILVSTTGNPCIQVNADAVRVASILFQAGSAPTTTLLQWGSSTNPPAISSGFLHDCFARVGRFSSSQVAHTQTNLMVQINSPNVVCDNLWLWRADHDYFGLVSNGDNPCNTAFQVNGDNVIAYGLAVEHTLQNLCEWNGNNGNTYFFQAEYPYDVTQAQYGTPGYVAYKVDPAVTSHHAWGVGVYSFFRDYAVVVPSGISTPMGNNIQFVNSLTKFLNGNGQISNVINNMGGPVSIGNLGKPPVYVCTLPPTTPRKRLQRR
jgi:hypothetical protein